MYTANHKINYQLSLWLISMFWIVSIMIVVGGVVPPEDYDELYNMGVACIFGPGTVISQAAREMIQKLLEHHE